MTDAEFVPEIAQPLSGHADDYDRLLQLIGDARVVLLGEATHSTDESAPASGKKGNCQRLIRLKYE